MMLVNELWQIKTAVCKKVLQIAYGHVFLSNILISVLKISEKAAFLVLPRI